MSVKASNFPMKVMTDDSIELGGCKMAACDIGSWYLLLDARGASLFVEAPSSMVDIWR